jgi:hypothetical protein
LMPDSMPHSDRSGSIAWDSAEVGQTAKQAPHMSYPGHLCRVRSVSCGICHPVDLMAWKGHSVMQTPHREQAPRKASTSMAFICSAVKWPTSPEPGTCAGPMVLSLTRFTYHPMREAAPAAAPIFMKSLRFRGIREHPPSRVRCTLGSPN